MLTSFCSIVESESCAMGPIRKTHEIDADADGDDQRVDHAVPVAAGTAPPDEQQDAGDQARIHRQVEDVADRRERQLRAEEPLVVVGDDVAGDEERLPSANRYHGGFASWFHIRTATTRSRSATRWR